MSKGDNKTTTNSSSSTSADPIAYQNYLNLVSRATGVSNKPYEAYGGEETAGINSQEQAGFQNINSGVAGFDPNQAWSDIGQGSSAVDANDIAKYEDPFTNQVINATQNDFDTQNKRANSVVTGNAAAQGALGGNRVGVAQALTQEGQERVQAPQIAALRSAGFQSAEQMANAQKSRQLQGGQTAEQLGMAGAQAQVGVGSLEQQTQQTADTQQMSDYYRAQGYDFQTAQWLASIILPTGSQMGSVSNGQSTTQGPAPNQWMQAAGLGVSAAAAFSDRRLKENVEEVGKLHDGQKIYRYNFKGDPKTQIGLISQEVEKSHPDAVGRSHGFGTVDYEAATDDAVKRLDGGRIRGFASGGTPSPWDSGGSWVPGAAVTGSAIKGADFPKHAQQQQQPTDFSKMGASLGKVGGGLFDKYQDATWQDRQGNNGLATDLPDNGSGMYTGPAWEPGFARGGVVRRGFAEGGVPISTGFGGGLDDEDMSPNDAVNDRFSNPLLGSEQYKNIAGDSKALAAEGLLRRQEPAIADDGPMTPRSVKTTSFTPPSGVVPRDEIVPRAQEAFKSIKTGVQPQKALGFAEEDTSSPDGSSDATDFSAVRRRAAPAAPGVAAAPTGGMGGFNPLNFSDEARQGLIAMGLNMMANRRGGPGSALASIGEGGNAGMATYASAKAATAAQNTELRKEAFEREKFDRPYSEMTAAQKAAAARAGLPPGMRMVDGKMEFIPGGPHDPETIRSEAAAKLPPSLMTPQSLETAADVYRMTGKLPQSMGRGVQGAQEAAIIRNRAAEKEQDAGGDPTDWANRWQEFGTRASGIRTFETRAAGLTLAENEARALVPRVRELLAKVDRTRFPDMNKLIIAGKTKTGNEEEIKLGIAIGSLIPVYARVLKPVGQVGQTDMANAEHLLEKHWATGQMGAALDQFEVELHAAKEALAQARKEYGSSGPALPGREAPKTETKKTEPSPAAAAAAPKVGDRKQFQEGWGVWNGITYVPEGKP